MDKIIYTLEEFISEVKKNKRQNSSLYYYRGEEKHIWDLKPSIYRNDWSIENEHKMFNDILSICPNEFEAHDLTFNKLVKMAHYSLPTRLLDITTNPLVALFFACGGFNNKICKFDDNNEEKNYGKVYIFEFNKEKIKYFNSDTASIISNVAKLKPKKEYLDLSNLNKNIITEDEESIKYLLHEIRQEKPQFECKIKKEDINGVKCVIPKKDNERIIAQNGAFLAFGIKDDFKEPTTNSYPKVHEKYITMKIFIDENSKQKILNELSIFYGIDKKTLFPDIDNVSIEIQNSYNPKYFIGKEIQEGKESTSKNLDNESIQNLDIYKDENIEQFILPNDYKLLFNWNIFMTPQESIDLLNKLNFSNNIIVDKDIFYNLLSNSLSLDTKEKKRVIDAIPTLSQFQVNELLKTWYEESAKFEKLSKENPDDIAKLIYTTLEQWYELNFKENNFLIIFDSVINKISLESYPNNKYILRYIKLLFLKDIIEFKEFTDTKIVTLLQGFLGEKEFELNILYILGNSKFRDRDILFHFFDQISDEHKDSKLYHRIAGIASLEKKYTKSFVYLEKIKNDNKCILDYVEIALLINKVNEAKEYLNDKELNCFKDQNNYEYIAKFLEVLIAIIEKNNVNNIQKKITSIKIDLEDRKKIKLSWNFKEIILIICKYHIRSDIKKFGLYPIIKSLKKKSYNKT